MSTPSTPTPRPPPAPPSIPTATSSTQTTIPTPPPHQPTASPSTNSPTPTQTTSTTPAATSPRPRQPSDAVLPRGTTVRISGNNRTKWDLIGRSGTVRTSQTLGGWHEVQLNDGGLVRVQRNALAVLQYPPDPPTSPSHTHITPALVHRLPPAVRKRGKIRPRASSPPYANLSRLNESSLRKYRSVYNLNIPVDCPRDELINAVGLHFETTSVDEQDVIHNFLRRIARRCRPPSSD